MLSQTFGKSKVFTVLLKQHWGITLVTVCTCISDVYFLSLNKFDSFAWRIGNVLSDQITWYPNTSQTFISDNNFSYWDLQNMMQKCYVLEHDAWCHLCKYGHRSLNHFLTLLLLNFQSCHGTNTITWVMTSDTKTINCPHLLFIRNSFMCFCKNKIDICILKYLNSEIVSELPWCKMRNPQVHEHVLSLQERQWYGHIPKVRF